MLSWFWGDHGNQNDVISRDEIKFTIQGKEHIVTSDDVGPDTTLNEYLRSKLFLMGTKKMCYEGGCGSCIVAVTKSGDDKVLAVNSCLVSILTCHGWKIETIEGIGGPLTNYNPVQQALANFNGTQCGFCSSGMVMNMYALSKDGKPTMEQVENSFGGNICRCTGYRPILTAFKSLCKDASPDLLGTYPDIEDFVHLKCSKENKEGKGCISQKPVVMTLQKARWTKVFTLKDLLTALQSAGDEPYMLVAGNTAKGVYQLPSANVYIDVIEVKELTAYQLKDDVLILGGNMSLTNTMDLFNQVWKINPKFAHLKTMYDHIDLVANVPVRNVGTIAGNLTMKHLHKEFPSDIFLILETFSATLVIVDTNGTEVRKSVLEFLDYDMNKKVIKSIEIPSLTSDYKYETYKIMPRTQNTHAIVNAGVVFQLDSSNTVKSARIVFGNITSAFTHATKTEEFFIGKDLFNNETLQGAFKILDEELQPTEEPPEPAPEARKQLAMNLLYKAILHISPDDKLSPKNKSAGSKMVRPISNGTQDYETNKSLYPLTQAIPKLEALAQTSGQAQYVDDIPDLPHQLYGKFVLAKAPANSKIESIDATKALALKGVVKFITKDDIPGDNNFFPAELGTGVVEKIFADKTIQFYHQAVGLIVATNEGVLFEAVELVDIKYVAPKTAPLLTIRDILKAKATDKLVKEYELKPTKTGDDVKHKFSGSFDIGSQYHFHMELQCCLAVPNEGGMDLYPTTQWMDLAQIAAAKALKLPQNKIQVHVRRCGGGFGGKISRNTQISCAASVAAWILKKPVRIALTLKENMELLGKRFPFSADYEVEVNDGGTIQHLTCQMYSDHASGGNESTNVQLIFDLFTSNYNPAPYDVVYYRTKTDAPANTWTRAPGTTEGMALLEAIMDHVASELNMDPVDVRMNNIVKPELTNYLNDLEGWADIIERKQAIATFNKENRWKKKGISVVPMAWGYQPQGPITATVSIYHIDGSVTICHGGIEIGQGINTKAAQVCAYKFNISLDQVNVYPSDSMTSANCTTTGGSYTSEAVCYSIIQACDELLLRLKPYRKENLTQTWQELITAAYADFVLLTANGQYSPKSPFIGPYYIFGSCASEVEVDILTGQHQLTRVDLIEDAGTSLSPFIDIGQVEGAFVMGMGYFTLERLEMDKDGKMLTNNTWTYFPPGAKDIPIDFRIKLPKNNPNPVGVLQSKAVGEPPLCMSVSIPLAIRNAIASARTDADSTKPKFLFFDGTTTVEYTYMNSLSSYQQYIL